MIFIVTKSVFLFQPDQVVSRNLLSLCLLLLCLFWIFFAFEINLNTVVVWLPRLYILAIVLSHPLFYTRIFISVKTAQRGFRFDILLVVEVLLPILAFFLLIVRFLDVWFFLDCLGEPESFSPRFGLI